MKDFSLAKGLLQAFPAKDFHYYWGWVAQRSNSYI